MNNIYIPSLPLGRALRVLKAGFRIPAAYPALAIRTASRIGRFGLICLVLAALAALSASASHTQDSTGGVTEEEYSIYASLIKEFYIKPDTHLAVIRERTFRYDSARGEDEQPWKGKVKGVVIEPSATEDFETKNSQHWPLDKSSFKLPIKADISSDADLRAIFHGRTGELEWMEYYKRYPDTSGLITLSRVGFNTAHTQGLVYIGSHCGPDCGDVHFLLLEKQGSAWVVKKVLKKVSFG